jgi:hypothetical protein
LADHVRRSATAFISVVINSAFAVSLLASSIEVGGLSRADCLPSHAVCCRSAVAFISVVIDSAFAVSLAGFLVMHANMLAANCTTIEMYEKERIHPWPYNKGLRRNFEEVFGKR